MQPGDMTERERLEAEYQAHSSNIAQAELEYNQAGTIFYILTICDDRDQGEHTNLFREAFWADSDNTFIPRIHQVRQLREQARVHLRNNNLPEASRVLEQLDNDLDDLAEAIVALEMHVSALGSHLTLPCTKDNLLQCCDADDLSTVRNHPRFREWVLKLPEIENAMELGTLETAEQAVRSVLEVEDRLEG